jgi:hypothetical protein
VITPVDPTLSDTNILITLTVFSPLSPPPFKKKGIEQPKKKRRKIENKKIKFNNLDETYKSFKKKRVRAREFNNSENNENDILSF